MKYGLTKFPNLHFSFRNPSSNMEKRDDDAEDIEDLQFHVKGM